MAKVRKPVSKRTKDELARRGRIHGAKQNTSGRFPVAKEG